MVVLVSVTPSTSASKMASVPLFLSLLSGSLNIVAYWGYVIWLHRHYTTDSWRGRDFVFSICQFLIAATIVGALFGKGRVRATAFIAGILGFFSGSQQQ